MAEERTFKVFEQLRGRNNKTGIPGGKWYTWSGQSRDLLHALNEIANDLPGPVLVEFGNGEYDYSLDNSCYAALLPALESRLKKFGDALHHIHIPPSIMLLTDLLPCGVSSRSLYLLFASARSIVVRLTGDPRSAIFAPLGLNRETGNAERAEQGEHPLHSDLYPPALLLNVFDNVPNDGSGASLFLAKDSFAEIVRSLRSIPKHIGNAMLECLDRSVNKDQYDYFFDLLHGDHPWTRELEDAIERRAYVVRFSRGEGYFLCDRVWLHGRTTLSGHVPTNRLHRLIFDNVDTFAKRQRMSGVRPGRRKRK